MHSIPVVFAQGAQHPLSDYLSFVFIIIFFFLIFASILSRDVEVFCVHADKFLIMIFDNKILLIEKWILFAYVRRNS